MIGRVNNYKYSPEKQKRFEAHQASRRQKLADSGFDFNSDKATNPAWGLINAVDEMKWNQKDNEKYGPSSDAAFALNAGETTNQGPKKNSLKISNKPVVKTKNKKSNLNKSGGSGALRISTNTINT